MTDAPTLSILIVDNDPPVAAALAEFFTLEASPCRTHTLHSAEEALRTLEESSRDGRPFDVVFLDLALSGTHGLEVLREVHTRRIPTAVVVMTGYGSVESAVEALRLGACDYLTKPFVDIELRDALRRARAQRQLLAERDAMRPRPAPRAGGSLDALGALVGTHPSMRRALELARSVAASRTTVLMTGESGTGKSLIARAIHEQGPRRGKPFVELSCGSIPETLLESELFGHARGAFTGAHADKAGRFLAANTGTIFLDEINSASPAMQLKLLRVLQERRFEPVGSTQTVEVDVRVIVASNQPLERLVAEGRFRQDLYYRINVLTVDLPPLRQRREDIASLADHFLRMHAAELGRAIVGFTPGALEAIARFDYPGNVRELRNVIERACVLCQGQLITEEDLPAAMLTSEPGRDAGASPTLAPAVATVPGAAATLDEALREPERRILLDALEACGWSRQRASDRLGINRTTLYKKLKAHGLLDAGPKRVIVPGPSPRLAG